MSNKLFGFSKVMHLVS